MKKVIVSVLFGLAMSSLCADAKRERVARDANRMARQMVQRDIKQITVEASSGFYVVHFTDGSCVTNGIALSRR